MCVDLISLSGNYSQDSSNEDDQQVEGLLGGSGGLLLGREITPSDPAVVVGHGHGFALGVAEGGVSSSSWASMVEKWSYGSGVVSACGFREGIMAAEYGICLLPGRSMERPCNARGVEYMW